MDASDKLMRYCARAWGLTHHRLPPEYVVPYFVTKDDGALHGFATVVSWDYHFSQHEAVPVSAFVFRQAVELSGFWMVPMIVVVKWKDKLGYYHHTPGKDYGAHKVDWSDKPKGPVVHLPKDQFRILRDLK